MSVPSKEYDDIVIYVPEEVVWDIDHALDSMEKARQGLVKARNELNVSENSENIDNEHEK